MKKITFLMMTLVITLAGLLTSPAANAATSSEKPSSSKIFSMMPNEIIIEQTATLSNGESVTIYYKKSGNDCEVFSEDNLAGYTVNDLYALRDTSFKVVESPKGKLIYRTTVGNAGRIINQLVNTYL